MISVTEWRRERHIRRTLRALARQRVAMVLQPGNVFVVERAAPDDEDTLAAIRTCHMRGWVEPMFDGAIPHGRVPPPGTPPAFDRSQPVYRLTDSGWAVIHRSHEVALLALVIALVGVIISLVSPLMLMGT